jgi:hypothetical protein
MAMRHDTAKKAAFNLEGKGRTELQRLQHGIDNETKANKPFRTYETNLVDITPSETATLTIMRGNVIIEQRASEGI